MLDKVKYSTYRKRMAPDQEFIEKIRSFNRFYTNIIGLLDRHFLDSPYSLTEVRILYEIHNTQECSAKKIRSNVDIDEGYLSRIIDKFVQKKLVKKSLSPQDGRLHLIVLTDKGKKEFSKLNDNSTKLISQITEKLSPKEREYLISMMEGIYKLLNQD